MRFNKYIRELYFYAYMKLNQDPMDRLFLSYNYGIEFTGCAKGVQ